MCSSTLERPSGQRGADRQARPGRDHATGRRAARQEAAQASEQAAAGRRWRKGNREAREAREAAERAAKDLEQARAAADRAEERLRPVADHQRRREGWTERTATDRAWEQAVPRELATRKQLGARALELDPSPWLEREIGRPTVEWGPDRRAAWRDAAERIDAYRGRYKVQDQERALGAEPPTDLERRGIWKKVMETIARARGEEPAAKVVGLDRQRGQRGQRDKRGRDRGRGRGRERSIGRE